MKVGEIHNGRRIIRQVGNRYTVECLLCRRQFSLRRYNVLNRGCGPCSSIGRINRRADYTGRTVANRIVLGFAYSRCSGSDRRKVAIWQTKCKDCGEIVNTRAAELRVGVGHGCGAAKRRQRRERQAHVEV